MTRRRALGAFPDRGALASSDGASAVTPVGSKVIGLSTLGVALLATAYVWASTVLMLLERRRRSCLNLLDRRHRVETGWPGSAAAHCIWG